MIGDYRAGRSHPSRSKPSTDAKAAFGCRRCVKLGDEHEGDRELLGRGGQEVSMTELTDAEIIAQSMEEPERFGAIFDRHVAAVHGYLVRRGGRETGDGLVGEVFRVAFEVRDRYRTNQASALPWLYGIGANVLRQSARSDRRQARLAVRLSVVRPLVTTLPVEPEDVVTHREAVSLALEAVDSLPAADRETLLLFTWENLSYEDIAVALDIPVGTVRSRLHRARARVREHLAGAGQITSQGPIQPDRECS